MASFPYPVFRKDPPVSEGRLALSAVGRCRIEPSDPKFREIVDKNIQQARVELDDSLEADQKKKDKKKYMKQGVAMAQNYVEQLQIDASVIDVDIVLAAEDVVATDGCLASCWLDAGCSRIVMDGTNIEALDAAKIPSERLVGHFGADGEFSAVQPFADSISIELSGTEVSVEFISALATKAKNSDVKISILYSPSNLPAETQNEMVRELCHTFSEGTLTIGLVDPTPEQLGRAYGACLKTDRPDGLYTTVVCARSGEALGLVYSSLESVVAALECGRGVYYSRSRGGLWRKGDTSGHFQTLHRLDMDCDCDALRFTVTQKGDDIAAFCHLNTLTCWGVPRGLRHLEETLQNRLSSAPEGSYTKRLFDDEELLRNKLVEEAQELSEADTKQHVAEELADVLYFAMVRAVKAGVSIDDAAAELDRRTRKVTRRKGDSKAFRIAAGQEILGKEK